MRASSDEIIIRTGIPTLIQVVYSGLCLRLPFVSSIYVANEVISDIVTDLLKKIR